MKHLKPKHCQYENNSPNIRSHKNYYQAWRTGAKEDKTVYSLKHDLKIDIKAVYSLSLVNNKRILGYMII